MAGAGAPPVPSFGWIDHPGRFTAQHVNHSQAIGGIARMSPATQIILSGTLTFGVPLVLAVRDLLVLKRGSPDGGWRPEPPEPIPPKPNDGGHPVRRPLPACLLEAAKGRPLPAPPRFLELV